MEVSGGDRPEDEKEDGGKGIISIRGIDKSLYRRISGLAKELDKSVGEVINEALELFIRLTDESATRISRLLSSSYVVKGVDELELSREDVKGVDKPVVFMNIRRLVIRGLDDDALNMIAKVIDVDEFYVYGRVNKVKLYSKLNRVGKVVVEEA